VFGKLHIIESLRSISFGGLLLAGIAGVVYILLVRQLSPHVTLYSFVSFFALFGAGLQGVIESVIKFIIPGVSKRLSFCDDLRELTRLKNNGVLTRQQYEVLIERRAEIRFLGDTNVKLLPPASATN
jgi:hypothetical protein